MGVSLSGVSAWTADDQLEPGTYRMTAGAIERVQSSNGNPQVKVTWGVSAGPYRGAERPDWVTLTERALGRVAQVIEAAGITAPATEFDSYEAMADWLAGALKGATVDAVVRLKPDRKDPSKEWPEIVGYKRPLEGSDVPADGPSNGAAVQADSKPLPFLAEPVPAYGDLKSHQARTR
jgi:hypothetical protein